MGTRCLTDFGLVKRVAGEASGLIVTGQILRRADVGAVVPSAFQGDSYQDKSRKCPRNANSSQPHIANHDDSERVHGVIEPLGQFRAARRASSGITWE